MTKRVAIALSVLAIGCLSVCHASSVPAPAAAPKPEIQMGGPFCDNAIIQRGMEAPVWGWSKPGTKVTVEFAGQKKTATAGKDGKWMVKLDKMKASFDPREMTITESTGKKVILKNILVGEVWMASGQSNMQWTCAKSTCNLLKVKPVGEKRINPIREFEVRSVFTALHPIEKGTGYWKDGNYSNYSAIAFAFAHKLYEELNVPIGILNCCWSQTAIQAWVPRVGYRDGKDAYTQKIYQEILVTDPTTPEHRAAWGAFYQSLEDQLKANEVSIKKGEKAREVSTSVPGNFGGNRDKTWCFNGRLAPVVPYAIQGAIWNQGYANQSEGLPYYNDLHSLIRGWRMVWDKPELPVYFHQFYTAKPQTRPSIGGTSEMRLGTWMARDIPNAGMASQIDISGAIHYSNKAVPGQRLALHALKNQYPSAKLRAGGKGADIVAEGPMYKSYEVKGDKLIVQFDCAEGGLVVADSAFNRSKAEGATGFADPKVIENGEEKVEIFWLAGEDRVWHPATCKIDGDAVIVSSDAVKKPRGVSYGSGGIGFQPCLYNRALLPMSPFIYYDNEMVLSKTWPGEKLERVGETIDPNSVGAIYEWRKMPILSTQFRDNAVFQADKPVTIWGSAQMHGEWGEPAEGDGVIHFEFGNVKKTVPVADGMDEWKVTLPPMKAGKKPYSLKVSFTLDGELMHERTATNIVFGDVWYVAAPAGTFKVPDVKPSGQIVRMIANNSKRDAKGSASRFSIAVSRTPAPGNRFAAFWRDAVPVDKPRGKKDKGGPSLAGSIGHSIAAKTGRPVGIIFMQNKGGKTAKSIPIKSWIPPSFLNQAPSLMADYETVGSGYPGNPYYAANVRRYMDDWKTYWGEYIPSMMKDKIVPDGSTWGIYPSDKPKTGDSTATHVYNVYVHCFTPTALSGIIFFSGDGMVADDEGTNFGPEMAVLANSLKATFAGGPRADAGGDDIQFIYTAPSKALAPKISTAKGIKGKAEVVAISDWFDAEGVFGKIK